MSKMARSSKPVILDRPLGKTKNDAVSLSAMSFLFSEMLQYSQKQVTGIEDLEKSDRNLKREIRLLQILLFINTAFWKSLFGKACDSLEKDMLHENEPQLTKFISVPKELSSLNCMAFVAGMVEAVLDASGFVSTGV
ncbi:TRAPP subunit trs31 [Kappamyces sp. JEL0680]|nr:TRAPP subunit trs31 [Kappamyces sp. JEL0680]